MAYATFHTITNATSTLALDFNAYRYRMSNTSMTVPVDFYVNGSIKRTFDGAMGVTIIEGLYSLANGNNQVSASGGSIRVEREALNTAPTTPGNFTQPTGTLEIGDSKVFSVGASFDSEGNLSKYIWEASINNGSYAKVGETTSPSFTYTIPTATSLKMRVKAADAGGLESTYKESNLLTISKPLYYYSRYQTNTTYTESTTSGDTHPGSTVSGGMSYSFNANTGVYTLNATGSVPDYGSQTVYQLVSGDPYVKMRAFRPLGTGKGFSITNFYTNLRYVQGALIQSNIVAIDTAYPTNGRHTDGYWYVRGSRVSQSIAPPAAFTTPAPGAVLLPKQVLSLAFGASTAPSLSTYEVESQYNSGAWTAVGTHSNTLTRPFTVTSDKSLKTVEFRVRAKNTSNVYSDWVYSESFSIQHNQIPTITLETTNNQTLYENDSFVIDGSALDTDVNDILNVKYQIDNGEIRPIETAISKGVAIPYKKVLTFKGGILYEDGKPITDKLSDGSPYTLKVWAEDDQGGKSTVEERIFFVVPNRPPTLSINPITDQTELINADKVTITGESFDLDGNEVVVRYRINNGINVEIHNGPAGPFSFDFPLSKLKDGENIIVVEVTDTHNFKSSKTIKLNKTANLTPLSKSVQRYTLVPPAGTAQGVLLWLERDELQDVTVEISMTNGTEQEQFKPMTFDTSGPANVGSVEDFFKFRADAPAEKIAIKLSWTGDKPIFKVSGALTQ